MGRSISKMSLNRGIVFSCAAAGGALDALASASAFATMTGSGNKTIHERILLSGVIIDGGVG